MSEITPYDDGRGKTEQVRDMFDNIAPAYDFLNRAMSFGLDKRWRRLAVRRLAADSPRHIVDIATGTGDFAISIACNIPGSSVTGLDLSPQMVEIGRQKVKKAALDGRVKLLTGDCLDSPLPPGQADAVTVAFGVRNFADLDAGYRAMFAMLRPGGMISVLELSTPVNPLVKPFYHLYAGAVIPLMGRLFSKDNRAYTYLPESIAAVPQGNDMLRLMQRAGFVDAAFSPLSLGVCTLYTAIKPS